MAQTIIIGSRDTYNINQDRRVVDMADTIALLQPSAAPLTCLLMRLQKKEAINPKFQWLEDDLQNRWDSVNGTTGTGGSIIVTTISYFTVGDIVKVPRTGECMIVLTVTTGTSTITVTRGYGSTSAAALLATDPLVIIGNANEEGATAPTIKTTKTVTAYNYTQIFRSPFGVTRTEENSELYGGPDLAYERKKKGIEHAVDIERAFLFGEPKEDNAGTHPLRTTAGVLNFISTNVTASVGTLTEAKLQTFMESLFQYGSDTKFLFCSPLLLSAINSFAQSKLQMIPKDGTYGINIMRYISAHGEINLIKHRLLEGTIYGGMGIAIDLKNLWYRPLRGSDTKLKTNIQANDEDGEKDEYITECGLQLMLEKTHAVIKGITAY